jgi:aminoglycoside phosphotransferase
MQGLHANETATALGQALRRLHGLPTNGSPACRTVDDLVALAAERVTSGAVSADDLRRPYARYGPAGLLDLAITSLERAGGDETPVVSHGACSADHLYVEGGRSTAWLRLDAVAVADRHLDLARLAKELADRAGPESVAALFDAYGPAPNVARLDALALLDELLP